MHTMPKDPDIAGYPLRRTHRTYTREFKAELVAACQQPGVSIAGLASRHAMNANVLHRWLKEHKRSGCHQLIGPHPSGTPVAASHPPAFIPLKLPTVVHEPSEIKVEIRRGALSMTVTWPLGATADFAQWATAILK